MEKDNRSIDEVAELNVSSAGENANGQPISRNLKTVGTKSENKVEHEEVVGKSEGASEDVRGVGRERPVAVVTPTKGKRKGEGAKFNPYTGRFIGGINTCERPTKMGKTETTSMCICSQCKKEYNVSSTIRYIMCPRENCNFLNEDLMCDGQFDPIVSVPICSSEEKECLAMIKSQFTALCRMMVKNSGPNARSMELLWQVKHKAVEHGLLLEDHHTKNWLENRALQEAIANVTIALEREDKVGFRKSFTTLMFVLMVGYSHLPAWKKK